MKGIKLAIGILVLGISGLITTATAQPKVSFAFKNISVPTAVETDPLAINNKNEIAGYYLNDAGQQVGFFLKGSKATSESCPSGGPTAFYGLNSSETGAEAEDDGGDGICGNGTTFFYNGPHPHWSFTPQNWGALLTETVGINDVNQAVGLWEDANEHVHGFLLNLSTGAFTSLDVPGAAATMAWGINNAGTITLQAIDAAGNTHSYLYSGGSYTLIDVPNAIQSFVHGINNNGDIVYTVEDANGFSWGAYFYATVREIYRFNQPDGRDNTRAYGINDEVVAKTGTITLKVVGEYTPPGTSQNLAYLGTITIKP